ncbi:hypothetical protein L249_8017 [Ophiocordyceps polyrhachis-furcata BCC 54312]|uniref:Uncharacterized protein n=1 Tax=Ophiocordyceps polyrhachis-furcata BCC 54312 TaxID=1330021 RepID=A0A367LI28_9HYPO|nr:hypothetical protein L249_8017 [Ophiocordyceps polyrhachis-furcata BCC 54312]
MQRTCSIRQLRPSLSLSLFFTTPPYFDRLPIHLESETGPLRPHTVRTARISFAVTTCINITSQRNDHDSLHSVSSVFTNKNYSHSAYTTRRNKPSLKDSIYMLRPALGHQLEKPTDGEMLDRKMARSPTSPLNHKREENKSAAA